MISAADLAVESTNALWEGNWTKLVHHPNVFVFDHSRSGDALDISPARFLDLDTFPIRLCGDFCSKWFKIHFCHLGSSCFIEKPNQPPKRLFLIILDLGMRQAFLRRDSGTEIHFQYGHAGVFAQSDLKSTFATFEVHAFGSHENGSALFSLEKTLQTKREWR